MKKYNYTEIKRSLNAELGDHSLTAKIMDIIDDCCTYGCRKPYMTTKKYKETLNAEIKKLSKLDKQMENAFIVKFHYSGRYAFNRVKYNLRRALDTFSTDVGDFEFYIWSKAISDTSFDIGICFQFYDENITENDIIEHFSDSFYCDYKKPDVTKISSIYSIIQEIMPLWNQHQDENVDLTWYPARLKLFMQSNNFGIKSATGPKCTYYKYGPIKRTW